MGRLHWPIGTVVVSGAIVVVLGLVGRTVDDVVLAVGSGLEVEVAA